MKGLFILRIQLPVRGDDGALYNLLLTIWLAHADIHILFFLKVGFLDTTDLF